MPMRETILFIAMSLDGYLADQRGGVGWLDGLEGGQRGYQDLLEQVDTVVMGWNTYHQIVTQLSPNDWPYAGLESYVVTHRNCPDRGQVRFTGDPCALVEGLKQGSGKDIWICGGANLAGQLLQAGLVDRLWISVVPVLLGRGTPLFGPEGVRTPLRLLQTREDHGLVELVYGCGPGTGGSSGTNRSGTV